MPETDLVTFAQDPLFPFLPNNSQKQEHMPQLHDYGVTLLRTPYSISETEVLLNVQGADARGRHDEPVAPTTVVAMTPKQALETHDGCNHIIIDV
jgi:hypothetical protein